MRRFEVFQARLCKLLRLHRGNPDIALQYTLQLFEFQYPDNRVEEYCPEDRSKTITEFNYAIGRAEERGWLKIIDRQIRWTTRANWSERWIDFENRGGRWDEFLSEHKFPAEVDRGTFPDTQTITYYFLLTKKCPAES